MTHVRSLGIAQRTTTVSRQCGQLQCRCSQEAENLGRGCKPCETEDAQDGRGQFILHLVVDLFPSPVWVHNVVLRGVRWQGEVADGCRAGGKCPPEFGDVTVRGGLTPVLQLLTVLQYGEHPGEFPDGEGALEQGGFLWRTSLRCWEVIASTKPVSLRTVGVSWVAAKYPGLPRKLLMICAECGWMGSPTMARVPALRTSNDPALTWFSPACSNRSATGERQMFPVQTVRILKGCGGSTYGSFLVVRGTFEVQPPS